LIRICGLPAIFVKQYLLPPKGSTPQKRGERQSRRKEFKALKSLKQVVARRATLPSQADAFNRTATVKGRAAESERLQLNHED
jgi:hypothetical protein